LLLDLGKSSLHHSDILKFNPGGFLQGLPALSKTQTAKQIEIQVSVGSIRSYILDADSNLIFINDNRIDINRLTEPGR
jgi:hypothetical protein